MRMFFLLLGHACVALAVLGLFLPILPTTPFVIAASACYVRSSPRFHRMLHESRWFGTFLKNWERDGSISLRAKLMSVGMITVTVGASIYAITLFIVKVMLILTAATVVLYIVTRPSPASR